MNNRKTVSGNPFMAPWERVPDGEPRVFTDPATGRRRMYVYGSHDTGKGGFCGPDHVVWSAPVEDLTDWRHDGVGFHIDRLDGLTFTHDNGTIVTYHSGRENLYAPDVVYHPQLDTYFMLLFTSATHHMFVAESKSPAGPFVNPRYVGQGFDPAVLVDDEKDERGLGRVYLYWSIETERSAWACELDPVTMMKKNDTLRVPIGHACAVGGNDTMPHRNLPPFYFFEGPSIRKIDGFYVLSYAKTDDKPGNGSLAEIGYAYSDNPYGDPRIGTPWQFGGVIVDNRGETIRDPYTGDPVCTNKGGNNHGGMAEVNGQWYQVYHRWTGVGIMRQAMAEPLRVYTEGGRLIIEQAEITSQGFRTSGLDPFTPLWAACACFGLGSYTFDVNPANEFDPAAPRNESYPVKGLKDRSWLGYKYFAFADTVGEGETLSLTLELKDRAPGAVRVWATDARASRGDPEQPRTLVGEGRTDGSGLDRELTIPLRPLCGKKAIYLEFLSDTTDTVCELNRLWFTAGSRA